MTKLAAIATLIGEITVLLSVVIPVIVNVRKISKGTMCQLRVEMLRIYYHNKDTGKIRQYEYENFVMLYEAYKARKGNTFIDEINKKIRSWEIIT